MCRWDEVWEEALRYEGYLPAPCRELFLAFALTFEKYNVIQ